MKRFICIVGFIPAIFMMIVMFRFSASPGIESSELSDELSYKIVNQVGKIPFFQWDEQKKVEVAQCIHGPIRKVAHFCEYALLAVLWILPLGSLQMMKSPTQKRTFLSNEKELKKRVMIALVICILYACSDEIHQLFVPGRDGNVKDVLLDSAGAVTGAFIFIKKSGKHQENCKTRT